MSRCDMFTVFDMVHRCTPPWWRRSRSYLVLEEPGGISCHSTDHTGVGAEVQPRGPDTGERRREGRGQWGRVLRAQVVVTAQREAAAEPRAGEAAGAVMVVVRWWTRRGHEGATKTSAGHVTHVWGHGRAQVRGREGGERLIVQWLHQEVVHRWAVLLLLALGGHLPISSLDAVLFHRQRSVDL